ncbi:MAG: hypothetical protein RR955_05865, partial [Raoultibacter sp.]
MPHRTNAPNLVNTLPHHPLPCKMFYNDETLLALSRPRSGHTGITSKGRSTFMEPNIKEVAGRIRSLREDMDLTMQEMAD